MARSVHEPVALLLITSSYLPVIGGSEIEAQRVCAALRQRGYKVRILCPGGPPMPPAAHWIDNRGIPVRIFGNRWPARLRGYVFALGVVWTLLAGFRGYRLAYFLMPGLQVTLGVPAAALLGKPVLMKFSGANEIRKLDASFTGRLQRRALRRWAACIMVLNGSLAEEAAEAGFPAARLSWMPNPVDTEEFSPANAGERARLRREFGLPPAAPVILFVGRLASEKELPSLLAAFAQVRQSHADALLMLVGDGPERSALERLTGGLGLAGSVRFAGKTEPSQVRGYLQAADIFALPSSLEGFPVSLLEAMAAGLPSVVSDIPANVQLIESERNGLVASLGDEHSIARALCRLLTDPELRARLGAAARLTAGQYSIDAVVDRYEALFAEAARRSLA